MADKTSLIVESKDQSGKTFTRSIADVNPNATDAQLRNFTQSLMTLSTNEYIGTTRVNKTDIDTEADKTPTTIKLYAEDQSPSTLKTEVTWAEIFQRMTQSVAGNAGPWLFDIGTKTDYNRNIPYISCNNTCVLAGIEYAEDEQHDNRWCLSLLLETEEGYYDDVTIPNFNGKIVISIDADATHQAASYTLNITKE